MEEMMVIRSFMVIHGLMRWGWMGGGLGTGKLSECLSKIINLDHVFTKLAL